MTEWTIEIEAYYLAVNTRCPDCGHSSNARNPHADDCALDGWDAGDPWTDFNRSL